MLTCSPSLQQVPATHCRASSDTPWLLSISASMIIVISCGSKSGVPAEAVLESASNRYLAYLADCGFDSINHPITLCLILSCLLQGKRTKLCCHSPAKLLWCKPRTTLISLAYCRSEIWHMQLAGASVCRPIKLLWEEMAVSDSLWRACMLNSHSIKLLSELYPMRRNFSLDVVSQPCWCKRCLFCCSPEQSRSVAITLVDEQILVMFWNRDSACQLWTRVLLHLLGLIFAFQWHTNQGTHAL